MRTWQPAATPQMLQARAALNSTIRQFFSAREVLEVETPLLARSIGTDPALQPIVGNYQPYPTADGEPLFLQTSPEFAMKRLLCAGCGSIYQLGKAFRNGESGSRHNPEFTMLEWYRPGFALNQLMDEVEALVTTVLDVPACRRIAYAELFREVLDMDPVMVDTGDLQKLTIRHIELSGPAPDRATCLELLYSHVIEPALINPVMIHDYPPSQAALARLSTNAQGQKVALRFELVIRGMEIANGYDELTDAIEQARRFTADQQLRQQRGLPAVTEDDLLLAAMHKGLPACSGVALGVDRLLMLITGATHIDEVLAFPLARI